MRKTVYYHARFALYLIREFRWPLLVFWGLVFGGGLLLQIGYSARPLGFLEASYAVFLMIFLEGSLEFPQEWYLQPLFFLLPILGLGAVADSMVRLGFLMFSKKQNLKEWQMMNASMMRDHFVVVGAGRVGYRIIRDLLALGESVVAVDQVTDGPLATELQDLGVPVIKGTGRLRKTLEAAGVARARAVILATDDDLTNLDSALTAKEIRPDVRVVLRLFDDTLAAKVSSEFGLPTISPATTAAPAFIAAATGRNVFAAFSLDGSETLHVADLRVEEGSPLAGMSVGEIQTRYEVNIVMHKRGGSVRINPEHDFRIARDDRMLIIAPLSRVASLR